ncbi:hypothetical protein F5887DRAFT_829787, partial [Amanita rubescens]
ETNGWPYPIEFDLLPERIIALSDQLSQFFTSSAMLRAHPIFKNLQRDLEQGHMSLSKLHVSNAPSALHQNSKPGYYGEQGLHIIEGIITFMFPPAKMHGDGFNPLSLGSFIHFFLVPFTATYLIAED